MYYYDNKCSFIYGRGGELVCQYTQHNIPLRHSLILFKIQTCPPSANFLNEVPQKQFFLTH